MALITQMYTMNVVIMFIPGKKKSTAAMIPAKIPPLSIATRLLPRVGFPIPATLAPGFMKYAATSNAISPTNNVAPTLSPRSVKPPRIHLPGSGFTGRVQCLLSFCSLERVPVGPPDGS